MMTGRGARERRWLELKPCPGPWQRCPHNETHNEMEQKIFALKLREAVQKLSARGSMREKAGPVMVEVLTYTLRTWSEDMEAEKWM